MTTINPMEWAARSRKGIVCGMLLCCYNNPTSQCPKCSNHYCYEHLYSHVHVVADDASNEEKEEEEVFNSKLNQPSKSFLKFAE